MKTFSELVSEVKESIKETDAETVKKKMESGESFHLVDVREESEWAKGHIPKAIHIGRGMLEPKIEKVIEDREAEIVLYCGTGARSALAAQSLARMGYSNVLSMAGGINGWKEAGLPTEGEE